MYKRVVPVRKLFLIVVLTLTACTNNPGPAAPASNTDKIAGHWRGKVTSKSSTGGELPPRDISILVLDGCTTGKVCGKLGEDGHCPGDIIFLKVEGDRYTFLAQTAIGTTDSCGTSSRVIELELHSAGTLNYASQGSAPHTGILQRR